MTATLSEKRGDWWNHPDRPCAGRDEWFDFKLIPRKGREAALIGMQALCEECPVLRECRIDALSHPAVEQFGLQAGIIFRKV